MKEPYSEGLASHTGPESCVGVREGTEEALTRVHMGQVLSCEIETSGTSTLLSEAEGNREGSDIRELSCGPAQSETLSMCGNSLHGNREIPGISSLDGGGERLRKAGGSGGKAANQGKHGAEGHGLDTEGGGACRVGLQCVRKVAGNVRFEAKHPR